MSQGLERRDVRLDRFLRGQLPPQVYERLASSEPCVVTSPEEKRVHRTAVLGHKRLFSTEFPPKNLKVLVQLEDIVSVDMLDDLPDFLSGEEQRNTVHVRVHYTRATPTSKRFFSGRKSAKKPRQLPADPLVPMSSSGTSSLGPGSGPGPPSPRMGPPSPRSPSSPGPELSRNPTSPRLREADRLSPTGRTSPQYSVDLSRGRYSPQGKSPPGMIFSTRSNLEITHHRMRGHSAQQKGEEEEDESPLRECSSSLQEIPLSAVTTARSSSHRLGYGQSSKPASSTHTTQHARLQSAGSVKHLPPHGEEYRLRSASSMKHLTTPHGEESRLRSASSMKHLTTPHGEESWLRSASSMKHLTTPHPEGRESQLKSASSMKQLALPTSHLQIRTASQPDLYVGTHWKEAGQRHTSSEGLVSSSSLSLPSSPLSLTSSMGNLSHLGGDKGGGAELAVLDIYVLKKATNFPYLLKGLWNDARMNQVLELGLDSPTPPVKGSPKYEQFCQHFITLKEELLAARGLEALAELTLELSTAAHKYFTIKKMFWEDSELLDFFTKQLHAHLLSDRVSSGNSSSGSARELLENRVEYAIIILDVLYQMLKEAQPMLRKKLVHLTSNSGQPLLSLASATTGGFPLALQAGHSQKAEFTEKACGVMYELFAVCEQSRWPPAKRTGVSVPWLVKSLSSSSKVMRDLVDVMLAYVRNAISSTEGQMLVTLYHVANILHTLVTTSISMLHLMREHFTEEFKYYISIPKGHQILPTQHSLMRTALELLNSCKSQILSAK